MPQHGVPTRISRPARLSGLLLAMLMTAAGLGCEEVPPWGVRVNGTVYVRHGADLFRLADARVILRDQQVGGYGKKNIQTDSFGRYDMEFEHRYGPFEICADAPGLPLTCNPEAINLLIAGTFPPTRDVTIVASDALHGQNVLDDGETYCDELLIVELYDQGSPPTLLTRAESNPHGEWILGELPSFDRVELRIYCAITEYISAFRLTPGHRDGSIPISAELPNFPPVIDSLHVADGAGTITKDALPGAVGSLVVAVSQADSDPLTYSWSDSADSVVSVDSNAIAWTTPSASQLDIINVTVDDGRGGVARASLELRIGPDEDRFIGHVYAADTGQPLESAIVDVDGTSVVTDTNGYYGMSIDASQFHLMNVSLTGYAPHFERLEGGAPGKDIRLAPLMLYNVDPSQDIEVWDGTRGMAVFIPANALEDAGGSPPPGNLDIGIHTHDNDISKPMGSRIAIDGGAPQQAFQAIQSAAVEIQDPTTGRIYNLKPGFRATVGFQAPDIPEVDLPPVYPLMHLDETTGEWEEQGEVARVGSRYEGPVSSFSAWSTGYVSANTSACVRVDVKGGVKLPQLLRVYWWEPPLEPQQHFIDEYTLQEHENVIYWLPENVMLILELVAFDSPTTTIGLEILVPTGGAVSPNQPAYPWTACQHVKLGVQPPGDGPGKSDFLNRIVGSSSSASSYYQSIGALPAKDTFQKWLDENQFPANAASNDVTFFNPNELGLTRRANCNQYMVNGQFQFACYVTKFGKLGESPQNSLWDGVAGVNAGDTVAMEFSNDPSLGGQRGVKFYIYEPGATPSQQDIKVKTAFDTDGENKYVPDVCMHCHGVYSPQWVVFDAHQYEYLGVGPSHLPNVQEQLREWNSYVDIIAASNPPPWLPANQNPARELIKEIYGPFSEVHTPGATAGPGLHGDILYDEIAKPYCRTCHMWGSWKYAYPGPFDSAQNSQGPTDSHICEGVMPNAMGPQLALWSSSNPFLPSLLNLGCVPFNNPPVATISAPAPSTEVGFGGLSLETYSASSTDVEDGAGCCLFEWSSDEGVMGYGHTIQYVFATAGSHAVCVNITDSSGQTGEDCVIVNSSNDAPAAVIHEPTLLQQVLEGQPHVFFGEVFDSNEAYLELPCGDLVWDFLAGASTPTPPTSTGCHPSFTFVGTGLATVRLSGTDPQMSTGQASILFNVVALPPGSPPGVAITSPNEGNLYPADDVVNLTAIVTSNGGGAISLDWTVDWGAGPVSISTSNPDTWVPSNDVPFNCGGQNVDVRLDATDSNGTGFHSVNLDIGFPAC